MMFFFTWFLIEISFTSIASITYSCLSNSTCGCSLQSAVLTKIIGGQEAEADTWGWIVSIRSRNSHICGGSLISSELVITAAHCLVSVNAISNLHVTAGSKYLSIIKQQRSISEIFLHRNYDSKTYANDIAIIRLSSPFDMNDHSLTFICLPTKTTETKLTNTDVVAIGWGILSLNNKAISNTLQQVTLKTIGNTDPTCRRSIRNEKVQFCAGFPNGGKDTCQGDSGGPLMMFFNEQWYLIGITSYGIDCALLTHAGVYTRVSVYEESVVCFLKNDALCIKNMFMIRNSALLISGSFYINIILLFLIIH